MIPKLEQQQKYDPPSSKWLSTISSCLFDSESFGTQSFSPVFLSYVARHGRERRTPRDHPEDNERGERGTKWGGGVGAFDRARQGHRPLKSRPSSAGKREPSAAFLSTEGANDLVCIPEKQRRTVARCAIFGYGQNTARDFDLDQERFSRAVHIQRTPNFVCGAFHCTNPSAHPRRCTILLL